MIDFTPVQVSLLATFVCVVALLVVPLAVGLWDRR